MRLLRSRHAPILLSLALFGLLIWWTNTPKRPRQDFWEAGHAATPTPWQLDLKADMLIDGLAYDHVAVADTFSHQLGLLALAFPEVRQDWKLDACCPGEEGGDVAYHAALKLHFSSRAARSAFLLGLQAVEGWRIQDQRALPTGVSGHAALALDMPSGEGQLRVQDVRFQLRHAEALRLS
jgi:hypothetical protein